MRVALLAEKADVKYDPDTITTDKIELEISSLGYHAEFLHAPSSGGTSILELKVSYQSAYLLVFQRGVAISLSGFMCIQLFLKCAIF